VFHGVIIDTLSKDDVLDPNDELLIKDSLMASRFKAMVLVITIIISAKENTTINIIFIINLLAKYHL
jgi:hypothetical protein